MGRTNPPHALLELPGKCAGEKACSTVEQAFGLRFSTAC
jgi:hypothetical protein